MRCSDIPWEDNYIGSWIGKPRHELHIRKIKAQHYLATLLADGHPIKRPWMSDQPTVDMPAFYSFSVLDGADFSIDLWSNRRFMINLDYEPSYQLGNDPPCEALTMGIIREADLDFFNQYYDLLGGFEHFIRANYPESSRS